MPKRQSNQIESYRKEIGQYNNKSSYKQLPIKSPVVNYHLRHASAWFKRQDRSTQIFIITVAALLGISVVALIANMLQNQAISTGLTNNNKLSSISPPDIKTSAPHIVNTGNDIQQIQKATRNNIDSSSQPESIHVTEIGKLAIHFSKRALPDVLNISSGEKAVCDHRFFASSDVTQLDPTQQTKLAEYGKYTTVVVSGIRTIINEISQPYAAQLNNSNSYLKGLVAVWQQQIAELYITDQMLARTLHGEDGGTCGAYMRHALAKFIQLRAENKIDTNAKICLKTIAQNKIGYSDHSYVVIHHNHEEIIIDPWSQDRPLTRNEIVTNISSDPAICHYTDTFFKENSFFVQNYHCISTKLKPTPLYSFSIIQEPFTRLTNTTYADYGFYLDIKTRQLYYANNVKKLANSTILTEKGYEYLLQALGAIDFTSSQEKTLIHELSFQQLALIQQFIDPRNQLPKNDNIEPSFNRYYDTLNTLHSSLITSIIEKTYVIEENLSKQENLSAEMKA